MNDKQIELLRYNTSSIKALNQSKINNNFLFNVGSDCFKLYLRSPYHYFENCILQFSNKNTVHLDLCCGDGIHSFTTAKIGSNVFGVDYSENSIEIAKLRAEKLNLKVNFSVCDVENLEFKDSSFDLITCVGSLSYLDLNIVIPEIKRLLKHNGRFVCLDSYNHNFFYRINRYIRFLLQQRTYSTLKRMPNELLINEFSKHFKIIQLKHFGVIVFLAPFLKLFFKPEKVKFIIDQFDKKMPFFKKYSFKM